MMNIIAILKLLSKNTSRVLNSLRVLTVVVVVVLVVVLVVLVCSSSMYCVCSIVWFWYINTS